MKKKLTITVDEHVYDGLYSVIGPGKISAFIENLIKLVINDIDMDGAYKELAAFEKNNNDSLEWSESLISDIDYD